MESLYYVYSRVSSLTDLRNSENDIGISSWLNIVPTNSVVFESVIYWFMEMNSIGLNNWSK